MRASGDPYRALGYDERLEAEAFDRLTLADTAGCRRALLMLAHRLRLTGAASAGDSASPAASDDVELLGSLLVDVAQRMNRRLFSAPHQVERCRANRLRIISRFARCPDAREARDRFLATVNDLLAAADPGHQSPHPLIQRAQAHITENFQNRISLSTIAEQLGVSPNYLSRLFRREVGVTLTSYVQRVRLRQAVRLLREGRHSISEIAYRVGYQNYRDFYRNFVKYHKASPREARRDLAGGRPPHSRPATGK